MIRNNLQAARGRPLVLLMVLLSLVIPVWAQTQGEDREQSQDVTRRGDQFRSLTAASQPGTKPEGNGYTKHQLGYYLDPNQVSFVRPGLKFVIQNVIIGADNRFALLTSSLTITGCPLTALGVVTPGSVSTSFVGAYIPQGQSQYVAYTTRTQTSPITGVSAVQASADTGGTQQQVGEGTIPTLSVGRCRPTLTAM